MPIEIEAIEDVVTARALCAEISDALPMWFGRPEANARYLAGMADRDAYAGFIDGRPLGLIALEYHFALTCNIWWLGVSPASHRRGLGRALIDRAVQEATIRGCCQLAVETLSPRARSPEYELTRRFYDAVGFTPFIEVEHEPGDYMMWMLRTL